MAARIVSPDQPVGPILVALPPLVFHHAPLIVEPFLRHGRQQKGHPVRFHPQGQFQEVRGHGLPIVGAVAEVEPFTRPPAFCRGRK